MAALHSFRVWKRYFAEGHMRGYGHVVKLPSIMQHFHVGQSGGRANSASCRDPDFRL
jgi:hypothetical protein